MSETPKLNPEQIPRALALWGYQSDTYAIALSLNTTEAAVYNTLAALREARREEDERVVA